MKNKFYLSSFLLFFILNGECSTDIVSIREKFIKIYLFLFCVNQLAAKNFANSKKHTVWAKRRESQ